MSEHYQRVQERQAHHLARAMKLIEKAEEWIDVDDNTLAARGLQGGQYYMTLADLHLRIRDRL